MKDLQVSRSAPLTDLGPLPEVRECNRQTTWELFLALQAGEESSPQALQLMAVTDAIAPPIASRGEVDVRQVLDEARRDNRVSPTDSSWLKLTTLLRESTGFEPPPCAPQGQSTPRLVKRMLMRDQIEWAADHGYLAVTLRFLRALPEENWVHMR